MNIAHLERTVGKYSGSFSGEVNWVWQDYLRLRKRLAKIEEVMPDVLECNGDMQNVHVPHEVFRRLREAFSE